SRLPQGGSGPPPQAGVQRDAPRQGGPQHGALRRARLRRDLFLHLSRGRERSRPRVHGVRPRRRGRRGARQVPESRSRRRDSEAARRPDEGGAVEAPVSGSAVPGAARELEPFRFAPAASGFARVPLWLLWTIANALPLILVPPATALLQTHLG